MYVSVNVKHVMFYCRFGIIVDKPTRKCRTTSRKYLSTIVCRSEGELCTPALLRMRCDTTSMINWIFFIIHNISVPGVIMLSNYQQLISNNIMTKPLYLNKPDYPELRMLLVVRVYMT